jgi:hypothetical protein
VVQSGLSHATSLSTVDFEASISENLSPLIRTEVYAIDESYDESIQDPRVVASPKASSNITSPKKAHIQSKDTVAEDLIDPSLRYLIDDSLFVSTKQQRRQKEWVENVPNLTEMMDLDRELAKKQTELSMASTHDTDEAKQTLSLIEREQEMRRKQYEEEDKQLILNLQKELDARRREREHAEKQVRTF